MKLPEDVKRWFWPITYGIVLFMVLSNLGRVFGLLSGALALVQPIIIGFFIAFVLNLPMRALERLIRRPFVKRGNQDKMQPLIRVLSILATLLGVGLLLTGIVVFVGPQLADSLWKLGVNTPEYVKQVQVWLEGIAANFEIPAETVTQVTKLYNDGLKWLVSSLGGFVPHMAKAAMGVTYGIVSFFMGFVFAIYMLYNKEKMVRGIKKVLAASLPKPRYHQVGGLLRLTKNTFTGYFSGQLTEAFVLGSMCFLGMFIFGIPYAPLVALLVGLTALVPVLGVYLGAIPSVLLILVEAPGKAIWFIILLVVIQQIEGNFIYPRIVGNSIGLTGFWVMAALVIGGSLGGIMGVVIGVPTCSIIYTLTSRKTNEVLKKKDIQIN